MDSETPPVSFPDREVALAVQAAPVEWERVESGGYSVASAHWRVLLADGRRAFVKHALTSSAEEALRKERLVYESLQGSFMPAYFGAWDDETTLLVLEDLSRAEWPPPWSAARVDAVLASLDSLHRSRPPRGLDSLETMRESVVGWRSVAADPEVLLGTGLCSRAWLEESLPTLVSAGETAPLGGDDLLHFDVRSDNLCFVGGQARLVDWNLACIGNRRFDVAFWLPSLALEGGPDPSALLPDAGALAAAVAGFFAARAGLPPPATAPTVREFQRAQAAVALPWAARELGLTPP